MPSDKYCLSFALEENGALQSTGFVSTAKRVCGGQSYRDGCLGSYGLPMPALERPGRAEWRHCSCSKLSELHTQLSGSWNEFPSLVRPRAVCRLGQSGDVNRTPAPLVLHYTEEEQDRAE